MASSKEYLQFVIEQLSPLDITMRPMMSEYLLYLDGVYFGGVFDDRLLVKPTDSVKVFGMEEQLPMTAQNPCF